MSIKPIFKKMILGTVLFATAQLASAGTLPAPHDLRVCPSVEELKAFDGDLVIDAPVSFDLKTKTMKTALIQERRVHHYGDLVFVLSGVSIMEGEDSETKAHTLISELQPDSETPIVFHGEDGKAHMTAFYFCSYSVPNNEDVKAMVFRSHAPHHHKKALG
jgi:hypothetical protein